MPETRQATPADLDALVALEEACFQPHRRSSRRSLARSLASPRQSVRVVDGPDGLAAAIVVWHHPRTVRVHGLATAPGHRGRGLAGLLLGHAEHEARQAGAVRMSLEAADEPALVAWYQRRGYVVKGALADYYGPGHAAVRLTKRVAA